MARYKKYRALGDKIAMPSYGIPPNIESMTFFQLSIKLSESKIDTPLYSAIDRQMKKIIAKDQSKINRVNVIVGAVMAGIFAIIGVLVGYGLESKKAYTESLQKTSYSKLQEKPKITNLKPGNK